MYSNRAGIQEGPSKIAGDSFRPESPLAGIRRRTAGTGLEGARLDLNPPIGRSKNFRNKGSESAAGSIPQPSSEDPRV